MPFLTEFLFKQVFACFWPGGPLGGVNVLLARYLTVGTRGTVGTAYPPPAYPPPPPEDRHWGIVAKMDIELRRLRAENAQLRQDLASCRQLPALHAAPKRQQPHARGAEAPAAAAAAGDEGAARRRATRSTRLAGGGRGRRAGGDGGEPARELARAAPPAPPGDPIAPDLAQPTPSRRATLRRAPSPAGRGTPDDDPFGFMAVCSPPAARLLHRRPRGSWGRTRGTPTPSRPAGAARIGDKGVRG